MTELAQEVTAEEVAQAYKASLDSVALLEAGKPEGVEDAEWQDTVKRNKDHLLLQIAKGAEFYGDLDLTPFQDAVK